MFRNENGLTTSNSFPTNHWVCLLTPLWSPRSKSYLRGKDELTIKAFSIIWIQIMFSLNFQLKSPRLISETTWLSYHLTHSWEHKLFGLYS